MARAFASANSQYMEYAGAVVAAYPISVAGWFNSTDTTNGQTIVSLGYASASNRRLTLILSGAAAGDPLQYFIQGGGSPTAGCVTTTGYSSGTWMHGCAVSSASNAHAVYINGGSKGTSGSNVGFPAANVTTIGRDTLSTPANYNNGMLAEVAIWDVALTDAEVAVLATGLSPLAVHPGNLVGYWPLIGNYSPEIDLVGGAGMTLSVSAPTKADHPRVLYAVQPYMLKSTYVAPPVVTSRSFVVMVG